MTTCDPLVTVLMSVYNGEKYLAESIESILGQTFSNFEFLIINDGSTDASRNIIRSYCDSRIVLIDNDKNIGLTRSLNKGIKEAKGKYIARMDADDSSLPERLEKQIAFMEEQEKVAAAGGWAYVIDGCGKHIYEARMETDRDVTNFKLYFGNQFIHGSMILRRNIILKYLYNNDLKVAQDYDLWFRLIADGMQVTNMGVFLLRYRLHTNNISTQSAGLQERKAAIIVCDSISSNLGFKPDLNCVILLRKCALGLVERLSLKDFIQLIILVTKIYKGCMNVKKNHALIKQKYKTIFFTELKHLAKCFFYKRGI